MSHVPGMGGAPSPTSLSREEASAALRIAISNDRMSVHLRRRIERLLEQGADPYTDLVCSGQVRGISAFEAALARVGSIYSGGDNWLDVIESFARILPSMAPSRLVSLGIPDAVTVDWDYPQALLHIRIVERMARHLDPGAPAVRAMVERVIDGMTGGLEAYPNRARCPLSMVDIALTTTRLMDSEQFRRFWLKPSSWRAVIRGRVLTRNVIGTEYELAERAGTATPAIEVEMAQDAAPNLLRWLAAHGEAWSHDEKATFGQQRTFDRIVARLLAAGVDLSAPRSCGLQHWSPLHVAACLGDPKTVSALLRADIDPDLRGPDGLTPESIARWPAAMAPLFARARAERGRRMLRHAVGAPAAGCAIKAAP